MHVVCMLLRFLSLLIHLFYTERHVPLVVLDDPFCALDKEVAKQARMTRSYVVDVLNQFTGFPES